MNRLLVCTCVGVGVLALAAGSAAGAVQVLYTLEPPDSGTTVSDRLTADGAQVPSLEPGVSIDPADLNPKFGSQSLKFTNASGKNRLDFNLGGVNLGTSFTVAAYVDPDVTGWTRTFTSYSGGGSLVDGEVILGFDNRQTPGSSNGLALYVNPDGAGAATTLFADSGKVSWTSGYHHLVGTYDSGGLMSIYFDGELVGSKSAPSGSLTINGELYFGEDRTDPRENEPFFGHADDVLILDRALSEGEMKLLASQGAVAFLQIPEPSSAVVFLVLGLLGWAGVARRRGR